MLIVHHLNNSRSQRILWLLEELAVAYEIKRYDRDKATMLAPAELKAIHPLGKSPVVVHDGRVLAETGAIIDYIVDRLGGGRLIPAAGTDDRLRYNYWMHYAEGSAMPPLLMKLVADVIPVRSPSLIRPIARGISKSLNDRMIGPNLKLHQDYWETELTRSKWFAGAEFTAADIMMSFPLEAAAARADALSRTHVKAFLHEIHARPAYKAALERGGPYAYA